MKKNNNILSKRYPKYCQTYDPFGYIRLTMSGYKSYISKCTKTATLESILGPHF